MKKWLKSLVVAAVFVAAGESVQAAGAPAGWELRNGSWVPVVEPGNGTPEAQVAQMIRDLQGGQTATVIDRAKKWIKANPRHPLVPQVLLVQGDAEVMRGNKYAALYPYEDLLNGFPTTELYMPTLEREYNIADAFLNGYKRKFLGFRVLPATEDALELLDRIQDRQRGSALAEQAGLRKADYYYNAGKFEDAIAEYTLFLTRYKYSQYVRKAEIRRMEANLADFRGVLFDFTPLVSARTELATIVDAFPQSAEELQARAVEDRIYQLEGQKDLEIARYYLRAGKKHAAGYYYNRVIANWPDTAYADAARKELSGKLPGEVGR
ncbi:MAG TPA: outer membrane protein assembly factor BamD [Phycisphaerae bacterium]|nr:outer membrane protein assembly factor BamD [Phycisphaerae bacterium]